MKPVTRGINITFKKPGVLQKLVDTVGDLVPLDKIKLSLKTTLYPQYARACKAVEPSLAQFGGVAGLKIIEFLKVRSRLWRPGALYSAVGSGRVRIAA